MGTNPPHPEPAIDGSRVCVTGGAGFIGSRLARRLLELGAAVTIIDDLSNSDLNPIADLLDDHAGQFRFIKASILEPAALREAIAGSSIVFHLAAISAAGLSLEQPNRVFDVNAAGTQRVCEAARAAGANRIVYAASCSAYGTHPSPQHEALLPQPLSPYAAAKLAAEHVITAYSESMNLPGVSLRFFNVYGPGQPAGSAYAAVIPIFIQRAFVEMASPSNSTPTAHTPETSSTSTTSPAPSSPPRAPKTQPPAPSTSAPAKPSPSANSPR